MPLLFPVPLLLRDHGNRTFAQVLAKAAVGRMADISGSGPRIWDGAVPRNRPVTAALLEIGGVAKCRP